MHLLRQPINLAPSVDKDDSLCDGQSLVEVTQRVQLPLLGERKAERERVRGRQEGKEKGRNSLWGNESVKERES